MARIRTSDILKALQARHSELSQQHVELAQSRRQLLLRNGLLEAWSESMALMQLSLAVQEPAVQEPAVEAGASKFQELLAAEVQLLKQLGSSSGSGEDRSSHLGTQQALEQLLTPEPDTISPATDPMAALNKYLVRPPIPLAATMSAQDFAQIMMEAVQTASIKLHQLTVVTPRKPVDVQQQEAIWQRLVHTMVSLIMAGRQSVIENAFAVNFETLECDPAAAVSHQTQQMAAVVLSLGLSEQQQELIAAGMRLFIDMQAAIHQERQELDRQLAAVQVLEAGSQAADSRSTAAAAAASSLPASSSGSSSISGQLQDFPNRPEQLQRQQDLTRRLDALLHKEYKLRFATMGFFVGALSYEQVSKVGVMSWPYGIRTLFLASEVLQQHDKLQQEQRLKPVTPGAWG